MKHLTDVLKSSMTSLYESIFDDDIVTRQADPEEYIKGFLKENYYNVYDRDLEIYKDGDKYIVNVNTDFTLNHKSDSKFLTNGLFEFGHINGRFICAYSKIESLKGAPKCVTGKFECLDCENLISLDGAPEYVGGEFICCFCDKLKSLKGAPKEVKGDFDCSNCKNLKSLEGAPKNCIYFNCSNCKNLKSLEGAPKSCEQFYCHECENLISLKGAPKECERFNCSRCPNLTSLEGMPKKIKRFFHCTYCGKKFTEEDVAKYSNVGISCFL